MSGEFYDVYFSGAIIKDSDPAEVKRKIGAIFNLQGEKLDRLFSGKPIPIKKGIEMDRAVKFRVTFRDAGGLVDIVPAGDPPPTPKPVQPSRPRKQAGIAAAVSRQVSNDLTFVDGPMEPMANANVTPITVPEYDLSSAQGFDLSDCAPSVEPAEIPDISSLDMEKPGSTLDESPEPEPLTIDTSALELDRPGVTLIEASLPEAPDIDIADLSMTPANQGSLEDCRKPVEPAPIPNIDHLNVVKPEQELSQGSEKKAPQGKAKYKIADD
ncbi:MAG: hypothetical protein PVI97_02390 [Candidatus Thiodiazotropha sp.]|jgi:hypothetical protein